MEEHIDQFVDYFQERLCEIEEIKIGKYAQQYQKTLMLSALDALARCVYPRQSNRKRFTAFIERFSNWADSHRVSLPHLARLLARVPDPEFSDLRGSVRKQLVAWKSGKVVSIKKDPGLNQIKTLWPKSSELHAPLEHLTVESFTHLQLFYTYRNSLVHEFRPPGHGFEWDEKEPFYAYRDTLNAAGVVKGGAWLLSYPLPFVRGVAQKCLEGLKQYLKVEQIDPYESYIFGDYWLESLNR